MANAKFKITGTASAGRGYDATNGEILQLQLEDQPPQDVYKCQYSIGLTTSGAPTPTFSPSLGLASPVGGIVELTMPGSGAHSYEVICTVNDGRDESGRIRPDYTFSRIVSIRSAAGLRKIFAAETTEYDPNQGWANAMNEMVETIDSLGAGTVSSVSGTFPIQVINNTTTPNVSIAAATSLAPGSMSAVDKAKLDNATAVATANRLVMYDGNAGLCAEYIQSCNGANLILRSDGISDITLDGLGSGNLLVPGGIQTDYYLFQNQQNLTRNIPLYWGTAKVGGADAWSMTFDSNMVNDVPNALGTLSIECDFPNGAHVTTITVRNKGAGTNVNPLPASAPTFSFWKKSLSTGVATSIATASATLDSEYRGTFRNTSISVGDHTIDTTQNRYYVVVLPEFGANSMAGCTVTGISASYYLPAQYAIGLG